MNAKLATRVKEIATRSLSQPSEAVQSPKEKSGLQWKRGADDWVIESACGRYRIRKKCVEPSGIRREPQFNYEAFCIAPTWDFSLGLDMDPQKARELCESHERGLTGQSA